MRIVFLLPTHDDWDSLSALLERLRATLASSGLPLDRSTFVIVDDGSSCPAPEELLSARSGDAPAVRLLELVANLGHQRAITAGLCYVAENLQHDLVIVLDSDGEDRPEDVPRLLAEHAAWPERVVVARRGKRLEGIGFRVGYGLYRAVFRVLTGVPIAHGNFSLLPARALRRLVHMPSAWNHFAASLQNLRPAPRELVADRGSRIAGASRMSASGLVLHGLRAMAVHLERICVRVLVASLAVMALSAVGAGTTIAIRLFTDLAIPGWASQLTAAFAILGMQATMLSTLLTFLVMHSRTRLEPPPLQLWRHFVASARSNERGRQPS